MKLILCFVLFLTFSSYSQNQHFKVMYGLSVNYDKFEDNDPIVQAHIKANNKQIEKLNFVLRVSDDKSLFQVKEGMASDNDRALSTAIATVAGQFSYFKNSETKIKSGDVFGEEMNILLDRDKYSNWVISKEKKKILGYTCFKATTEYKSFDKNEEEIIVDVYAWFTPEIPVSAGPLDIDGLPGLILEASRNDRFTFIANKIELNPDDKSIEHPDAGKTVSSEEYEEIVKKVLKMIRERG